MPVPLTSGASMRHRSGLYLCSHVSLIGRCGRKQNHGSQAAQGTILRAPLDLKPYQCIYAHFGSFLRTLSVH